MATAASLRAPTYYRLYVWETPVRIFHWVNGTAILLLAVTGFLIGSPYVIVRSAEAYQQHWFGWIRFIHFGAGYLLLFNFVMRIYWGFVGDQYARWHHFLPLTRRQRREIMEVLRVDILQTQARGEFSSGHNALAAFAYLVMFVVLGVQIAMGFALYAGMSDGWLPPLFAWIVPLMGNDAAVRFWHHALMWFFVVFAMVHIYLVFYHDYVEGRATTSSMVGGWKFARTDYFTAADRRIVAVEPEPGPPADDVAAADD